MKNNFSHFICKALLCELCGIHKQKYLLTFLNQKGKTVKLKVCSLCNSEVSGPSIKSEKLPSTEYIKHHNIVSKAELVITDVINY